MNKEDEAGMDEKTVFVFYQFLDELVKECLKKEDIEEFKKLNDVVFESNTAFFPLFICYNILYASACLKVKDKDQYLEKSKEDPFILEKNALRNFISILESFVEFLDEAGEDILSNKVNLKKKDQERKEND
jgi:hypothetical protein